MATKREKRERVKPEKQDNAPKKFYQKESFLWYMAFISMLLTFFLMYKDEIFPQTGYIISLINLL